MTPQPVVVDAKKEGARNFAEMTLTPCPLYMQTCQGSVVNNLAVITCKVCGKEIQSSSRNPRMYCSGACKSKAFMGKPGVRAEYRRRNREAYRHQMETNPEVLRERARRKCQNPLYRLAKNHRTRISNFISQGEIIHDCSSLSLFGCTIAQLKKHIESQFTSGMTWENYGSFWEVDHILPLSSFNLLDAKQKKIAFNWSNMRPLRKSSNRRKSWKITKPQMVLPILTYEN